MKITEHLNLAVFWVLWCVVHSALISASFMGFVRRLPPSVASWHRMLYVVLSVATLLPVLWYQRSIPTVLLWEWEWPWVVVQWSGLVVAFTIFLAAVREYDHSVFFGWRQIREGRAEPVLDVNGFRVTGVLGLMRHPYYSAGILVLLFYGDGDSASMVMRITGIAYLYIGTLLEERKLVAVFGEQYLRYRSEVPMFMPRIWRKNL